jgi:hypothetical protein
MIDVLRAAIRPTDALDDFGAARVGPIDRVIFFAPRNSSV